MGEIPLPPEIGVLVIVCADLVSQVHVLAPFLGGGEATDTVFETLVYGIMLRVGISHPDEAFYVLACTHTRDKVIIAANCEQTTLAAVGDFHTKASHAENFRKIDAAARASEK
jgi:hypothetical protein